MIRVYDAFETDFSHLGLCGVEPTFSKVHEIAAGAFELEMECPITDDGRWAALEVNNILKAPCPVRETPSVVMGGTSTTTEVVTRLLLKVWTSEKQKLYARAPKYKGADVVIGSYPKNSEWICLGNWNGGTAVGSKGSSSGGAVYVCSKDGSIVGWFNEPKMQVVSNNYQQTIEHTTDNPPVELAPRQTREQLFRIVEVERDSEEMLVKVRANHIFYDMIGEIVNGEYDVKDKPAAEVLQYMLDHPSSYTADTVPFTIYLVAGGNVTGDYTGKNWVECLLDPDIGIASQLKAKVIRDNFDVFILPDEQRDRGVEIRHGKNLKGAVLTKDMSTVVTKIQPVGRNADGNNLYIEGGFVISDKVNDYPVIYSKRIEYDVAVGNDEGEYPNDAAARQALIDKAKEDFEVNHVDEPTIELEVDFVSLADLYSPLLPNYEALQSVHLYDTVTIIAPYIGVRAKQRMSEYSYDCLTHEYTDVKLGDIYDIKGAVYNWQLPSGGITGDKLQTNSVDDSAIKNGSISYAKLGTAVVDTLAAGSISAGVAVIGRADIGELEVDFMQAVRAEIENAKIHEATIDDLTATVAHMVQAYADRLKAGHIETDTLSASMADIVNLHVEEMSAGTITTDKLAASLAKIVSLAATTADIELADIKNLLVKALVVESVTADMVSIRNLAVTSANMLNASIDNLRIKSTDGKYYRLNVDSDGKLTATEVEASDTAQEVEYSGSELSALTGQYAGDSAVFRTITAESISTGTLTAMQATIAAATIPTLQATAIKAIGDRLDLSANETIVSVVGRIDDSKADVSKYVDSQNDALKKSIETAAENAAGELASARAEIYSRIQQERDSIRAEVNADGIAAYMDFDADGLRIGKDGQNYRTLTNGTGFHVEHTTGVESTVVGSFSKRAIYVENVRVGSVSNNGTEVTTTGKTVMKAAPDGGVMFTVEG